MTDSDPNPSPPDPNRLLPGARGLMVVFAVMLVFLLLTVVQRWDASILDRYESRQVQTALSIDWLLKEGFRLDYLTPLFGPPWSIPFEFPIYQWSVAAVSSICGMHPEQAGRLVSIFFFLALLPAVYDLLGFAGLRPSRRLLALAVLLSTPLYLFYTRTVLVETTALCFSVWFLCLYRRAIDPEHGLYLALATLMAVLAALTKITTFLVYCVPAALLALHCIWREMRARRDSPFLAARWRMVVNGMPVALAGIATLWWLMRSDAIKASNPFTVFLTSTELREWNFGTAALRAEANYWKTIQDNITRNVLSEGALALTLCLSALATVRVRWIALACLAGFASGPLIFANLYHIHDYYYTANALLLTGAAGLVIASAWDNPRLTRGVRWLSLGTLLVLQYNAFDRGLHYHYWKEAPPPPEMAELIRQTTPPDGVVLISGIDWDPVLAYYSGRRAIMIAQDRDHEIGMLEEVLARLPAEQRIAAMVLMGEARQNKALIRARVARFKLSPQPFASTETADLYLPAEALVKATALTGKLGSASTHITLSAANDPAMHGLEERDLSGGRFPMFSPAPSRARSLYDLVPIEVSGQAVIGAHAPSEIYFQPPPGATGFSAVVGLAPFAYGAIKEESSDGVVVSVYERQPDGLRRRLLRRTLNPFSVKFDRGPQELVYEGTEPFKGELIFSIDPGRAGNPAYDQTYWARIEIR